MKVGDKIEILKVKSNGLWQGINVGSIAVITYIGLHGHVEAEGIGQRGLKIIQTLYKGHYKLVDSKISKKQFSKITKSINKMSIKTVMQSEVLRVAKELAVANNRFTTLELKKELIKQVPEVRWTQQYVSDTMIGFEKDGKFTFTDNGTFRTYSLVKSLTTTVKASPSITVSVSTPKAVSAAKKGLTKIKRTKALDMMKESHKAFITVEFIKQDGTLRKLNGQFAGMSPNGGNLVLFHEASKLKSGVNPIRNVNLDTLQTLSMKGTKYAVK